MTLAPRFLVNFLANYRVRRLRSRLKAKESGTRQQQATLLSLLSHQENTAFGKEHKFAAIKNYDDFRTHVPLRTSAEFRSWVERMAAGEADVLWPGRCRFFVYTAGTVAGTPKLLPATANMLRHFRGAISDALLLHASRAGHAKIFGGLHLHVGASTALSSANGAYAGYLEAVAAVTLSEWSAKNIYAPHPELARLPEGPEKTAAIATQFASRDVRVVVGTPSALIILADTVRQQASTGPRAAPNMQAIWPHFECAVHTGALLGLLAPDLQAAVGPGATLHEVYSAAEGIFAVQDGAPDAGLRLSTDSGIFFEFLPLQDLPPGPLAKMGSRCIPLEKVEAGVNYSLVVSTPAGLSRCVVGDSVRFISTRPPRLIVTGRTELTLNSFGEQVTERMLSETLLEVCARNLWKPVNFHVAPYLLRAVPRLHGCHEWWIELCPGTVRTPTGPVLADELDAELSRRDRDYATCRANGVMAAPLVRLVMPGLFTQWSEAHPVYGGGGKLTSCRNDRLVADQLAGIAKFHSETLSPFFHSR